MNMRINLARSSSLYDIDPEVIPASLRSDILDCIRAQKNAAKEEMERFEPAADAAEHVSRAALESILKTGRDVHGIASESEISNVIHFSASHIEGSVHDKTVKRLRSHVDDQMGGLLKTLFKSGHKMKARTSGHFWYPPGSFMSWHTNSKAPGWRVYINYAETEGDSFFRYFQQDTGEVVTLEDRHWNLRVFPVSQKTPFWHCVHSQTHRFSLGYLLVDYSLIPRLKRNVRRMFT
ncbi:hypothetical protein [Hoeflea poritis]|uniref:Prolyl 4-hydroxylase alpha subunit Fe(2+) 2OG dioxygenase domain-containing protein n=1 Tax=Hoeflea poritis TaxID=2993659 RepID=A0ABT4VQR5_9HYPH|nr:hypothetical protein [Hoeflea poritis]MDA4847048.1 hypothetical protein [Hoeflea poritis]